MMLAPMMVCGLLVQPVTPPPQLLQTLYLQHYGCAPRQATAAELTPLPAMLHGEAATATPAPAPAGMLPTPQAVPASHLSSYFPARQAWWPLFSAAELGQSSYTQYLAAGVKPGVVLPDNPLQLLSPRTLWRYRQAVRAGAIPVLALQRHHRDDFAGRATFAAALGLRPVAALVTQGWSDNLLTNARGSYLVDHRAASGYQGLPLPARHNGVGGSHFYLADAALPPGGGFAVRIDPPPPDAQALATVNYPVLAMSWNQAGVGFRSTLAGLETSPQGHLLALGSLLAVPVALFFDTAWPPVLRRLGTSISWAWLVIGAALLSLLVLAALRRWRRLA